MLQYIAIIRKDADSDFSLDFPDLPGCISGGSTLEEVKEMGSKALALHLFGLQRAGLVPPIARTKKQILADSEVEAKGNLLVLITQAPWETAA